LFYNVFKDDIHKLADLKQQISQKMRLVHEATFDFVAFDNVSSTLLLVWTGH